MAERDNTNGVRDSLLQELEKLRTEKCQLEQELKNYERSDPKILLKMEQEAKIAKDAVNRWTDNLFQIMQWIKTHKPNFTESELCKSFPIFKELDYME